VVGVTKFKKAAILNIDAAVMNDIVSSFCHFCVKHSLYTDTFDSIPK
jgi:hypothetical protein